MANGYLTGCALAIGLLVGIIFCFKCKVNNIETKIFKYMVALNILEAFCTTSIVIVALTTDSIIILKFINRMDVIILISWCSLMFYYIYNISQNNRISMVKRLIIILNIIMYSFTFILDVNIINSDGILNSSGPLTIFGLIAAVLYILLMVFSVITRTLKNKEDNVKYIPLMILIILLSITAFLRLVVPEINFISIILSFVTLIMYFTIENPDMKMIEQLNIANDQANKANMAKSDFLSSMSHEIRTPLNAIVGFSECIENATELKDAQENAKDVITASNTLLEIVNGILDISKIEAGKLEIVNSNYNSYELFNSVAKLLKPRMEEKALEFKVNIAPDIPAVLYGDHANIKKAITNIITNACKYTEKGTVEYKVSCVNDKETCRLVISVEDTGRGIKPENINKLFTRFQRLEEDRNTTIEGTGLGLAITKKILELMNGTIVVQSVYGSGSKFTIALDQNIKEMYLKDEPIIEKQEKVIDVAGKKILIVDDNLLNIKVATKLLEKYNVNTASCESGFECIEKIKNNEIYDLILMDDMMPKMSGVETLIELLKIKSFNVPVVALTANAVAGMKEKYINDGFDDYLAKPIDKLELQRVLEKLNKSGLSNNTLKTEGNINNIDYLLKNEIDLNKSLELLGDVKMYNEILEEFYHNINNMIEKLNKYKENDMANYAIEINALKSDSKYLGFKNLFNITYEHEIKSKENNIEFINSNYQNLITEINRIVSIIKEYLGK